jgi:ribosome-binding factor A
LDVRAPSARRPLRRAHIVNTRYPEQAMAKPRMRRIDEAIREVLAGALAGGVKDPRVGFVTVTAVRTSPDISHAQVFVSALEDSGESPGEQGRARVLAGLQSAHGYLQRRLAGELRLKRTPVLQFVYDETAERAMRLNELILEAEDRSGAPGGDDLRLPPDRRAERQAS